MSNIADNIKLKDKALLKDLIDLYLQQTPERSDLINSYLSEQNSNEILELAHKLRSASLYVGGVEVSEICKQMEEYCDSGDVDFNKLKEMVDQFNTLLPQFIEDLKAYKETIS